MADASNVEELARAIANNWWWIAGAAGTAFTAVFGLCLKAVRWIAAQVSAGKEWATPKLNEVYNKHVQLVDNLNIAVPDMADKMKNVERITSDSHKLLLEIHDTLQAEIPDDERQRLAETRRKAAG